MEKDVDTIVIRRNFAAQDGARAIAIGTGGGGCERWNRRSEASVPKRCERD